MTLLAGKDASKYAAIIPVIVTIVCLAPFVDKAFHIDDPLFIWSAKQIQNNPTDFYGFSVNWYGSDKSMAKVMKNPPIACYYIALVGSLFGYSEPALHIAFLVPAAMAAMGIYYLARQLCCQPVLAALAAVLTPGFLVSSSNVMCDTMMLALWIWSVVFWLRGIKTNKQLNLLFSAFLIAACALTKYFGIALLPMLFVYALMQKRSLGLWSLYLLIPVIILAGYHWATYILYGRGLLLDAADYATQKRWMSSSEIFSKGLVGLAFAGGCALVVLFYSPLLWSRRFLLGGIALTVLLIFVIMSLSKTSKFPIRNDDGLRWVFLGQFGLMATAGISVLVLAGMDLWKYRNADSLMLLVWVVGTFIFAVFINWTINARSVLPMIPAVGILLVRRINRRSENRQLVKSLRSLWPLVLAAVIALSVCWADYSLAGTARNAAERLNEKFENWPKTIWFQGHWGFQYYMEAEGYQALDFKDCRAVPKDIVIIPSNNTNVMSLPENMIRLNEVLQFSPLRWLATMNRSLGAGFYTDIWGPLPYVLGAVEPEKYYVLTFR